MLPDGSIIKIEEIAPGELICSVLRSHFVEIHQHFLEKKSRLTVFCGQRQAGN
jgi:hypothetical protein